MHEVVPYYYITNSQASELALQAKESLFASAQEVINLQLPTSGVIEFYGVKAH